MRNIFEPNTIEKKWYSFWCKYDYFKRNFNLRKFTILLPPPNITGNLHMGHAFQNTIIDILLRYNKLNGKDVFLQAGTDHAGIATQIIIERVFLSKKIRKDDFFLDKILSYWVLFSQQSIYRQIRLLGTCVNWDKLRFTLDENYTKLVCMVFTHLYNVSLIYRDLKLVNWDPVLRTAISDLEVISCEESSFLWYIRYFTEDYSKHIVVATTRPETIFGDVAVAVNPSDYRYVDIIGNFLYIPLLSRRIPVIEDYSVDVNYGSGCLKVTPAHSFTDYEIGKRHALPIINIFNEDATLNKNVPIKYQNIDRFRARDIIVEDLKVNDFIVKVEVCNINLPRGDRTNSPVEPYLTKQWFIYMYNITKPAITVVKNGTIKFFPEQWSAMYLNWVNNIKDWCISRQLWWGHKIPIWYDCNGNVFSGSTEEDVRIFYDLNSSIVLTQENDVLDTWFSSALWPFSIFKTCNVQNFKMFRETDVLVTGFDIIFFWVVRMVVFCLFFTTKVPFKIVYIHGLVCDNEGKKMSKFKGNILDPLDLMYGISLEDLIKKRLFNVVEENIKKNIIKQTKKNFSEGIKPYGSDAVRLTFCSLATYNSFISFDIAKVKGFKNLLNKIWNVARCVILYSKMCKENFNRNFLDNLDCFDFYILTEWENVKFIVTKNYELFKFNVVVNVLCDFIKLEYCYLYLETTKNNVIDFSSVYLLSKNKQFILLFIFEEFLRVLHPITPFITEEIWQKLPVYIKENKVSSILGTKQPAIDVVIKHERDSFIFLLKIFLSSIRCFRGSKKIKKNVILKLSFYNVEQKNILHYFYKYKDVIFNLCKLIFIDNKLINEDKNALHEINIQDFIFYIF